ncbi:MAG TPA: S8 family serine peptidase [Mycobacteriales bacterium]|nr:S8 family serine peptidase [Mycobacteriales bacterium]
MRSARPLAVLLGAALALPTTAAVAGAPASTGTVQLAVALPTADRTHLASAQARAVANVMTTARALGLSVRSDGTLVEATASPRVLTGLFGSARDRVPAALAGIVTAVSDPAQHDHPLHARAARADGDPPGATTPAELDTAYGLPAPTQTPPTAAELAAAPIVATVQFANWHAQDLTDYAQNEHIYTDAGYSPVTAGQLTQVNLGVAPYNDRVPDQVDAADEVALDQEALLGAAPQLRQRTYLADNSTSGFIKAYDAVLRDVVSNGLPITVLSTSWGACELKGNRLSTMVALEQRLRALTAAGVTVVAAAGDSGRYDCSNDAPGQVDNTDAVDFPSSSPFVLAVGGTAHTVASPPVPDIAYDEYGVHTGSQSFRGYGSGGGVSKVFNRPVWQAAVAVSDDGRMVPDLAADADVDSGIRTWHDGLGSVVGGTSLSAPLIAGQLAWTEQLQGLHGVGDVHAAMYRAPQGFTDVTQSPSAFGSVIRKVRVGYDEATGLGTPRWNVLGPLLAAPAPAAPTAATVTADASTVGNAVPLVVTAPDGAQPLRWYVGAGTDPGCWGIGSPSTPTSATVVDGPQRIWVRYTDSSLVCSAPATTVTVAPVDERRARRQGAWQPKAAQSAFRHTLLVTGANGARISHAASGTTFGVVVVSGPGQGRVQLLLDGRLVRTANLGRGPRQFGTLLAVTPRRPGRHTLTLRVLGTAHRTVAVDGFLVTA